MKSFYVAVSVESLKIGTLVDLLAALNNGRNMKLIVACG